MTAARPAARCRPTPQARSTLSAFTFDSVADLPGAEWLRLARAEAAGRVDSLALPTSDEEIWRYTPIDDLDFDSYSLVGLGAATPAIADTLGTVDAGWGEVAALVVTVDDRLVSVEVSPGAASAGLRVRNLADSDAEAPSPHFEAPTGIFGSLNIAYGLSPVEVAVPAGAEIPGVIHIVRCAATAQAVLFPRLLVDVGRAASVSVVEHHRSIAGDLLVVPRTELALAPDSRARYLAVNDLADETWQLSAVGASVDQGAHVSLSTAAFGGRYARQRTDCRLLGRGASADLQAAYFGNGDQTLDFRTLQDHRAPDTTSNLLFKGALDDRSRSVYSGLIKVRPEARNTNAYQTNHNVKLSDEAWAESVPNLEIETNDVQCSHASTVGPIDEDQRFYLEARGVRPADAERLVLTGFFEEVIGSLGVPQAADPLRRRLADKVRTHSQREAAV